MQYHVTKAPAFLQCVALFEGLDESALRHIAKGATEIRASRGTILFREGDVCHGLHLVISGQVKISSQTVTGEEKIVLVVGKNESIGEAALFLGEPYSTTAEVVADTTLIYVEKDVVLGEASRSAAFSGRVIRELCRQLRQRTFDLQSCMLLNGTQRVIRYLLSQLPQGANGSVVELALPAKKGIIASQVNLTQEHFSRILHDLVEATMIEVHGRTVRIRDVGQLRNYGLEHN